MRKFIGLFCLVLLFGLFAVPDAQAPSRYAVVSLEGTVNPIIAEHITSSIAKAQADGVQFIVLTVDTPGGLLNSMREIIKSILTSNVPVVVYTYPKGAQAASAGGFIMLAGHVNAMAPGTEIGAMHPVSPFMDFGAIKKQSDGKDVGQEVMAAKVLNDTVAYGKSIAQKRNRNAAWTERAIREAVSATYTEARSLGIVDIVAEDMTDLLKQLDGRSVELNGTKIVLSTKSASEVRYDMNWKEKFMNFFADPQIVFFLFIIAVVGIGIEFKNPGMIVPGTVGTVSFLLFLMAVRILPINFAGLALIILSIVLFVLELKFTSYGLLTLGGVVSFVLGSMFLFDSPLPGFAIPISSIATAVVFILIVIFGVVRAVLKAHKGKVVTGEEGMVGEIGESVSVIGENGKVKVHGELWNARSDEPIPAGVKVEVKGADGLTLVVKRK